MKNGNGHVDKQRQSNGKRLGGVTGKGFLPGKSGNPGGRRKGRTLMSVIREKLATPEGDETKLELSADAFIDAMTSGSFQHLKEFIEREDGKVPDKGETAGELVVRVLYQDMKSNVSRVSHN